MRVSRIRTGHLDAIDGTVSSHLCWGLESGVCGGVGMGRCAAKIQTDQEKRNRDSLDETGVSGDGVAGRATVDGMDWMGFEG